MTLLALAHFGIESKRVATAMSLTLGVTLLISALLLVLRNRIIAAGAKRDTAAVARTSLWATVAVGFLLGVLVSLSSVGAGALGTVALFFLYPRLPVVRIVGSDIAHAVPLTLLAGLGHWFLGTINFHLLGSLLVGSIPGIVIGSLCGPLRAGFPAEIRAGDGVDAGGHQAAFHCFPRFPERKGYSA